MLGHMTCFPRSPDPAEIFLDEVKSTAQQWNFNGKAKCKAVIESNYFEESKI